MSAPALAAQSSGLNTIPVLGLGQKNAGTYMSFFMASCYFLPLVGGYVADNFFGKYWTIVGFSIPYIVGQLMLGIEDKTFLVRVYKKQGDDTMYVVIAGTRRSHFARLEAQLREALDSFRLLDRNGRPDW